MTLQFSSADTDSSSELLQSNITFPTVNPKFNDLIDPSDLHQFYLAFQKIFIEVLEENKGSNNRTEYKDYILFAKKWNENYRGNNKRIPPFIRVDRYGGRPAEYNWGRDMTKIWPLFGMDAFYYDKLSKTKKLAKNTKQKVQKIVDISALEMITSFCGEVIRNNSLLRIEYSDLRRHWKKNFGNTLGVLPPSGDLSMYPEIKNRIAELLKGTYLPAEHIEMENIGVQEDGIGEDDSTPEPARVVPVMHSSALIAPTIPTGVMKGKIYSEKDYSRFLLHCDTINPEYKTMIPRREEINKVGVIKETEYIDRLKGEGKTLKMIENAMRLFSSLLDDK